MRKNSINGIKNIGNFGYVLTKIAFIIMLIASVIMGGLAIAANVIDLPVSDLRFKSDFNFESKVSNTVNKEQVKKVIDKIKFGNEYDKEIDSIELVKDGEGQKVQVKGTTDHKYDINKIKWALFAPLVATILLAVNLFFIMKLFKVLKLGQSPFTYEVVNALKVFGYSLIPWAFLDNLGSMVMNVFNMGYDFEVGFNLQSFIVIALVFVLVKIFEYGVDLQTESDDMV